MKFPMGAGARATCSQSPGAPSAAAELGLCTNGPPAGDPALLWEVCTGMEPAGRCPVSCCLGGRSGLGVTLDTGVGLSSSSAFNLPRWNRYIPALCLVTLHASVREDMAFVKPCSRRPLRRWPGLPCLCRLGNGSSCPPGLRSCLGLAHTRCFSLRRWLGLLCTPSLRTFTSVSLDETGLCLSFLLAGGLPFLSPLSCPGPGSQLSRLSLSGLQDRGAGHRWGCCSQGLGGLSPSV